MLERDFKRKFKDIYKERMDKAPTLIIDCDFSHL